VSVEPAGRGLTGIDQGGTTMTGIRRLVAALALSAGLAATCASSALAVVYPNSMAATGASATRAANTCEGGGRGGCPENSWATGTNTEVNSIYLRIRAVHSGITGNLHLDAIGGQKMSDLSAQMEVVVEQRVEFVIVDMGGNDFCAPEEREVTSVASFRADFETAMSRLIAARPNTRIAVVSITNLYRLWEILHTTRAATDSWNLHTTCQSMLANPTSTSRADNDRRARVREAEIELNATLATVCARYANCEYDRGTAFEYRFEVGDVGRADYFHPSLTGQATNALVEWEVPWMF
jgi:lysophospholipase L1-like esterase